MSDKESRVYLALLEAGQATIGTIAELTKLKRPIIYVTLESLQKRGFAQQIQNKRVATYAPGDPSIISARLNTTAKQFAEMLPYLLSLEKRSGRKPRITYFDTAQAIWGIYKGQGHTDNVLVISSYARLAEYFPEETEEFIGNWERGLLRTKGWRQILTDAPQDIKLAKRLSKTGQKVRTISSKDAHVVDIAIYGNKLSLTLIDEEPFIVVLESEPLAKSMRGIFEIVWRSAKPIC